MRRIIVTFSSVLLLLLVSCSGSDTYRGKWKALDSKGEKFEINFDAKNFTVKDSKGQISKYEYSQNQVSIENSVETYGIQLEDGRTYHINFPIASSEEVGLIKDSNENPIYTIARKDYTSYEDIFKLK
ncbi:glycosyl transferase [Flavobacterium oreochromis]|uniref:Uncharacterized protein n=1 Tax=Flavobacterium columnare TaxID=996 RepID=A0A246GCK3_9FLAO|nr:glycosyl transferase [Flavobacterium oreochromis]OWP78837.1 hypothetical protein BWK62_04345 [Flavobacterium oreochromis]QYS87547.1 hypothetical protein JJC03_06925 [Flavobacterium oreochromis]